jgi:hypothetical protein
MPGRIGEGLVRLKVLDAVEIPRIAILATRVQLTTDAQHTYLNAVDDVFWLRY